MKTHVVSLIKDKKQDEIPFSLFASDKAAIEFLYGGDSKLALVNQVNMYDAQLRIMKKAPNTPASPADFEWVPTQINFESPRHTQSLRIELVTDDIINNEPRFWLHRIEAERPDLIQSIEQWGLMETASSSVKKRRHFKKGCDRINITFQMDALESTSLFKLNIYIKDRTDTDPSKEHDCDPQVGNGPP